jgi:hypothetical protein
MEDKQRGVIVLIFALILLGVSFAVNAFDLLAPFGDTKVGEGFGTLCGSEGECKVFCGSNMGRCLEYCKLNQDNEVCNKIFVGGLEI